MVGARGVRHPGRCMLLSALENPLHACGFVALKIGRAGFSGRTIDDDIRLGEEVRNPTTARVAGISEGLDAFRLVKGAEQRVPLSNGQITAKRRTGLGHTDHGHVVLRSNRIRNALSDGAVTVDGDPDGHAPRCPDRAYELHD